MPSRKKARGRQNRAKKEATRTAELRSLWEPTIHSNNGVRNAAASCGERLALISAQIPQEGPAVSFMNFLAGKGIFGKATKITGGPVQLCFESLSHFPEVVAKDSERSLAFYLLLRFVRNVFLRDSVVEGESWFHQYHNNEVMICCMINLLELRGTYSDPIVARRRAVKTGNKFVEGNRRDTVKFVAKRLPCTCLKELHRAARKNVAKVGTCNGCLKRRGVANNSRVEQKSDYILLPFLFLSLSSYGVPLCPFRQRLSRGPGAGNPCLAPLGRSPADPSHGSPAAQQHRQPPERLAVQARDVAEVAAVGVVNVPRRHVEQVRDVPPKHPPRDFVGEPLEALPPRRAAPAVDVVAVQRRRARVGTAGRAGHLVRGALRRSGPVPGRRRGVAHPGEQPLVPAVVGLHGPAPEARPRHRHALPAPRAVVPVPRVEVLRERRPPDGRVPRPAGRVVEHPPQQRGDVGVERVPQLIPVGVVHPAGGLVVVEAEVRHDDVAAVREGEVHGRPAVELDVPYRGGGAVETTVYGDVRPLHGVEVTESLIVVRLPVSSV
ncbi:hypothetical protein THAOC_08495 [Thalassiosira oceanica]|uniref:Uncharacterized protein n=1 Tax=Thalassiosira oceanica TaxID=159749 RepID=K0SYX0_THAOC|nr:hypothetical protein THAOC_08495 [Thalassiosira oceanica]|eukprot:EJK70169.1 hypothetical protein THAOC_08495 [Thalassiosira oceanica]